jgi:hypothetical protein
MDNEEKDDDTVNNPAVKIQKKTIFLETKN